MDHTQGKCACGHYHPKHDHTNPNIIEREWIDVWNWVASRRLMSVGTAMDWESWINLGPREPKAQ